MPYVGALSEVSNRASWNDCIEVRDIETNEPVDISSAQEIVVQVSPQPSSQYGTGGYSGSYSTMLVASLSNGKVSHVDTGVFQFKFARSEMNPLAPGIYDVGVTIVMDEETVELIIGTLPVRDGVVTVQTGNA